MSRDASLPPAFTRCLCRDLGLLGRSRLLRGSSFNDRCGPDNLHRCFWWWWCIRVSWTLLLPVWFCCMIAMSGRVPAAAPRVPRVVVRTKAAKNRAETAGIRGIIPPTAALWATAVTAVTTIPTAFVRVAFMVVRHGCCLSSKY
ncbi:hypothetical protein BKA70DRAFT_1271487 [Coprinopsis sp. MPI-PUGE-AT-0042]|nr:hypothetical protein BKA70DRAFT_1271487 [Coprinopsis sp. MPI-PUGE-AT-0042]